MSDKLCVTGAGIYVSSFYNHCMFVYSMDGEFWFKVGEFGMGDAGRFRNPFLCELSSPDDVLLCDWRNHRLQVINTPSLEWTVLDLKDEAMYPVSAALGKQCLWVGTVPSLFGPHKLLKYEQLEAK